MSDIEPTVERYRPPETLPQLDTPLLVLVQEPNPRLFKGDPTRLNVAYGEAMTLVGELSPLKLKLLDQVVYEPAFISRKPINAEELSTELPPGYEVILKRFLGPYQVYGIERTGEGPDRFVIFKTRKDALRGVTRLFEDTSFRYQTCEMDREPRDFPDLDTRRLSGLTKKERTQMKDFYQSLFEEHFLARLRQTQEVADYPEQMFQGLSEIREFVFRESGGGSMDDPRWLFCHQHISPLVEYLDYRLHQAGTEEAAAQLVEIAVDYDFVVDLMKTQALLLTGEQGEPSHRGVVIPVEQLEGATNYDLTSVWLTDNELVINNPEGTYKYPLPVKAPDGEVAFKGGIARLVAKVVLEQPSARELPPSDLDLVVFGDKGPTTEQLRSVYGIEPRDVERIHKTGIDGYSFYLGNRDQSLNEVLLTTDGLVISLNAVSSYLQNTTEAAAEPYKDIFGRHVVNLERNYVVEMLGGHDVFFARGARFPTPRALARMYKNVIEDKADSFTVPRGALKMDIGIHWLVMARKFMAVADKERRSELLNRMVLLAYLVGSPHEKTMQRGDPHEFIERVKEGAPGGKEFNMEQGVLSDKETLDWIAGRLVRQITDRLNRYVGSDSVAAFEQKLAEEDMLPVQITLPRLPEAEARDKIDREAARKEHVRTFFESFSYKEAWMDKQIAYFQEWVENWFPTSSDYQGCNPYVIRTAAATRFYQAAQRLNFIREPEMVPGLSLPIGEYQSKDNIAFVVDRGLSRLLFVPLFEEVFHSTGRHMVTKDGEKHYLAGFEDDPEVFHRGSLFEEGLAGMTLATFLVEHNLDQSDYIEPQVVSVIAGTALTRIFDMVGSRKAELSRHLSRARIGNKESEQHAREVIDERFGTGFFDYLVDLDMHEPESIIRLYERLRLRQY